MVEEPDRVHERASRTMFLPEWLIRERTDHGGVLVLSPHFDDAVMSCGELIGSCPGTVVATVCSASPGVDVPASPEWDALAGFDTAEDAVLGRREEDRRALATLGAVQAGLGWVDELYRRSFGWEKVLAGVVSSIGALLDELRPRCCFFPIGLGGGASDHELTRGRGGRCVASEAVVPFGRIRRASLPIRQSGAHAGTTSRTARSRAGVCWSLPAGRGQGGGGSML